MYSDFFLEQARAVCIIIPEQLYAHRFFPLSLCRFYVVLVFLLAWWRGTIARLVVIFAAASLLIAVARQSSPRKTTRTTSYGSSREQRPRKYECINA